MRTTEIEKAKEVLKANGYFVDNLWHINDVKDRFECTPEDAQEILLNALTNESVVENIFYAIEDYASEQNIERIFN